MATKVKRSERSSVYDALPSPAAGLLHLARMQAGMSQQELAERAGVDRTMVSAYEHYRRQPSLPTLLKLLKAAGFELRMHLEPYDDHDDVLATREVRQRRVAGDERNELSGVETVERSLHAVAVAGAGGVGGDGGEELGGELFAAAAVDAVLEERARGCAGVDGGGGRAPMCGPAAMRLGVG